MITSLYNSTFSIYKAVYNTQSYGNTTISYILSSQDLDCYITVLNGNETNFAGKLNVQATHRLFCSPNNLTTSDRIYVTETDTTYNVLYVNNCSAFSHHYEVLLESI